MKIVGNTVGMGLPKPDLRQTDPRKGDFVYGKDEIENAVNDALSQAKASGEFKGDPGSPGKDGADGYTPVKGVDYFDGEDGQDGSPGKDGTSATHSWNGTVLTVTSASGTSSADLKGEPGKDGNPGKDGSAGADGVSPTVAVSKSGKATTVSITDKDGTKTATINDGADGAAGSAGKDGTSVTVKSVSESTADGGSNVVTFSDGKTITIKNGSKGSSGASGTNGKDGKTPVKGVDFWTAADQESIVQDVIRALGTPVFGRVDADNNIILTGGLANGTYTLKYEDTEGEVTEIGALAVGGITNLADPKSADWLINKRYNSSNALTTQGDCHVTNFVACKAGDVVRVKGLNAGYYGTQSTTPSRSRTALYTTDKSAVYESIVPMNSDGTIASGFTNNGDAWAYIVGTGCTKDTSKIAYIRFCGDLYSGYTENDVIITVNEEIV